MTSKHFWLSRLLEAVVLSMAKLEVLFVLCFASMDGDSAQPETVLSQGQAISAPSLSAGPAANGWPAASAPTFGRA